MKRKAPLKRTRLSPVSKKRKREMQVYNRLAKEIVEQFPLCQAWLIIHSFDRVASDAWQELYRLNGSRPKTESPLHGLPATCPLSTDCHHVRGRSGKYYLDKTYFMALSRVVHTWVHNNPLKARGCGLLQ